MATFSSMIGIDSPVLIDFTATWCGPCKMMEPIIKEVKTKMGASLTIYKIDIDKNPKIANDYRVQGVPILILFKQGKELWRSSGVMPAFKLIPILQSFIQ